MNDSSLNEKIFDSKIWKKDSQDEKEEPYNSQITKNKKSKNSSLNSNSNSNSNNSNYNNSINNNSDNNNNNSSNQNNIISNKKINSNNNIGSNTIQKKFSLPLNSIPYSLKKKKELNNNINTNNSKNVIKPIGTKGILQSLPSCYLKSKDQKVNMLERIKDKVNKEIKENNKIIPKLDLKTNKNNNKKNEKNNKLNIKDNKNESINRINQSQVNNFEDKKDKNDFEEEELVEDLDDEVLQINKVASIDVKSNIMNKNYFQSSNQFYSNNSNNNSNKSLTKEKCFTESDDSFHKSNLFDPPSGRSNNSNKTFLTANSYQGNKTEENYSYSSTFQFANVLNNQNNINNNPFFFPRKNTTLMGSFLSTGANSHSQSGQRFDTSNSNESGQSPHNFNAMERQFSNNNLNNNYMMQINPLERYSNNYNSKEFVFKQPFSLNASFYCKKNKNNLFSKNKETKQKQIINLEDIARGIEKRTTIMIRNVPIKYNTKVLEKELEYFNGKFDCLYIPFDYENGGNKGYAFLNLVNPYHVLLFYEVFQGKCWSFYESKKICELNFANFQGIKEIKKHASHYKGTKHPTFYINTNNAFNNTSIEVPKKYLCLILEKNPNLKYIENKLFNTIIINSFN